MSNWLNEFVTYLQDRVGDSLRAVGRYNADGVELGYVRDDLSKSAVTERLETVANNITDTWSNETPLEALGRAYTSLQIREKAIILHISRSPGSGVIFAVEPEIGRDLRDFVVACNRFISDE